MINAPVIPNAVMIDKAIGEIQDNLASGLPWLNAAFGRAQRLARKMPTGKTLYTPHVYCGGWNGHGPNDYIEVMPDAFFGNFCFFTVDDPHQIDWLKNSEMTQRVPFSIVFWFDCRTLFNDPQIRNTEYVKAQILEILNGRAGFLLQSSTIKIERIYERADNIYRGYSHDEIDNQYLMHPYAGFRFEGVMEVDTPCRLPDLNR